MNNLTVVISIVIERLHRWINYTIPYKIILQTNQTHQYTSLGFWFTGISVTNVWNTFKYSNKSWENSARGALNPRGTSSPVFFSCLIKRYRQKAGLPEEICRSQKTYTNEPVLNKNSIFHGHFNTVSIYVQNQQLAISVTYEEQHLFLFTVMAKLPHVVALYKQRKQRKQTKCLRLRT